MRKWRLKAVALGGLAAAFLAAGCTPSEGGGTNGFLSLAQLLGRSTDQSGGGNGGTGTPAGAFFREPMTIQFQNLMATIQVNFSFIAWVNTSSIRSADQQDALFSNGYVQLTRTVQVGTAVTLPPGTFVFNGPGQAGATLLRLEPGECKEMCATGPTDCGSNCTKLITPDGILVFRDPPSSCDSVAFEFTQEGQPLLDFQINEFAFGGTTGFGARKTLAQVEHYQCEPFQPGLFLRQSQSDNENLYLEGDSVMFAFQLFPDDTTGFAAAVTITTP